VQYQDILSTMLLLVKSAYLGEDAAKNFFPYLEKDIPPSVGHVYYEFQVQAQI